MAEDPKISQRYRELPREEPPRALDDAILAASRRTAETRPAPLVAPTGRRRWYFPLAAAAVIVLAVALAVHVERGAPDQEMLSALPPEQKTEEASEAKAAKPAERPRAQPRKAPQRPAFTPDPSGAADSAGAATPAPAAPATAPSAQQRELREMRAPRDEIARARAQGTAAPAPSSVTVVAAKVAEQSPDQWLREIADLRRQGRDEEADKALAEFRKRYPDYRLSDEMRATVERKRQ